MQKNIIYICSIIVLILFVALMQSFMVEKFVNEDKILDGVYVNGTYVGGLTTSQASKVIDDNIITWLVDKSVTIINADTILKIDAIDVAEYDCEGLTNLAYNAGRTDSNFKNYLAQIYMRYKNYYIDTSAIINWESIYNIVQDNEDEFLIEPIDATIDTYSFVNQKLNVTAKSGELGYALNSKATTDLIFQGFIQEQSNVYAIMDVLYPKVDAQHLDDMGSRPYSHQQVFYSNINKELYSDFKLIDENSEAIVIQSGEEIDLKEFINYGKYKVTNSLSTELYVPSIIYGCALQAGFSIVEHHVGQYIPVNIYQAGQEAIISYNKNLVMINDYPYPMIVDIYYDNSSSLGRLVCNIYSPIKDVYPYVRSMIEESNDSIQVSVYRVYANDTGGIIDRELVENIKYIPTPTPPVVDGENQQ